MRPKPRRILPAVLALAGLFAFTTLGHAQSVTTGAAGGKITDQMGAPLANASIMFTYNATGFRVSGITNERGLFTLQGLQPGSYTVQVSLIGYRTETRNNVSIGLGQSYRLDASLEQTAVELEPLVVQTDQMSAEFSPSRTGTSTTINEQQLEDLPTLDRRFTDLAKLTPQIVATDANAGLGLSVVGQNNRYNTIQIDGSTVNDRFGLGATGAAGGQANGKPIGYDAVKEYQVLLSPYDVRQGNFTGALINAITKSGGNEWFGGAFGYFRNQDLAGDPLSETEFKNWQYGASLGGPIVQDQAFFFANAEFQSLSTPATGPYIGAPTSISGVQPDQADIDAMNSALATYGMQPGDGNAVTNSNPLTNLTLRADWSLGDNNRLVFRYSYNHAGLDVFNRTTSTSNPGFRYQNNAYQFADNTHNPSLQWFTNFTNGNANEFRLSYNRIRDARDPFVEEPQVGVMGFTNGSGQDYGILTGSEQFSQGNRLNQDIVELTDNFTFAPMGDHTITVGTRNEFYKVYNLFAQSSYGVYEFDDLAAFQAGIASQYTVSGNLTGGPVTAAEFNAGQLGFYAQDQWQVSPQFALTFGVRVDIPLFFDQPTYAPQVNTDFNNPDVPSGQFLFNPRLGFNWDIDAQQNQQLRGGIGIFTGNPAYVWMSNAYSNNGTGIGILSCGDGNPNGTAPAFSPDPFGQTLSCAPGTATGGGTVAIGDGDFLGEIDLIGGDTKYPQVMRANLAYDRRLPKDFLLTLEGIFNMGINDYFIVNRNFGADGTGSRFTSQQEGESTRVLYGTQQDDGRSLPNYFRSNVYGTGSVGVFDLLNTSENFSYNLTAGVQKFIGQDLRLTAAYTYSHAEDVQSFTSSRATSNWRFGRMNAGDQLVDVATTSSFDRPSKVTASATYEFPWKDWPTKLALVYIGYSGTPYTYISGGSSGRGDLNADGIVGNDPVYVITGPNDPLMNFNDPADAQAYDALIAANSCLNEQRGSIMERNSCRNPWQSFLDLSVTQGLPPIAGTNRFSVQLGVFNLLNLLNSDWGQIETAGGGVFDSQTIVRVSDAPGGVPNFDYSGPTPDETFVNNGDNRNSWQLQLMVRYEFGSQVF
jgi:Carboxypeptidase regulatory-like domain